MTAIGPDVEQRPQGRPHGQVGLAAVRMPLGPATLVTLAADHVALRTPSRPDCWDGNAIHLLSPPDDVRPWVRRFTSTIGALPGVERLRLMWPDSELDGPAPAGIAEEDLSIESLLLMRLVDLCDIEPADIQIVQAATDKDWHAAAVLLRHETLDVPHEFWDWMTGQVRAVCEAGHGSTWIARRHGIPIARTTLVHDGQGLAALDAVGTHPVYRGAGVATTLVHHAISAHLDDHPDDSVVLLTEPYSAGERVYRRLGFEVDGVVVQADRAL